jgi:hypothetical protein
MVMNPDANDDGFDDFATAAGAALRRPAPDNGLAAVRSSLKRRRITQVAVAGGAAVIVFAAGALLLGTNQDNSQRLVSVAETVSTSPDPSTSTTAPTTTAVVAPTIELRLDGIGPHSFGEAQSVVEATLTEAFGAPEVIDDMQPAQVVTCVRWGCSDAMVLHWPNAGLVIAFSDRTSDGDVLQEPVLAAWTLTPTTPWRPGDIYVAAPGATPAPMPDLPLALANGIGLGSTVSELRSAYPSTAEGLWSDSSFVPTGFYVPDADGTATIDGDVAWDVVTQLQSALVAEGAALTVNGVAGPDTAAALTAYSERAGLDSASAAFDALGITGPPPEAMVVRLSAGDWFWELSCGGLEPLGIPSGC